MECSNGYKLLPSSIYNNCSICKYVCLSFPYTRFPPTHPYPWQPYGQCVLPFAMYGGYCQLIIQLQPWIEKVFDFAISNFTWPLAEKRIENNKKGSNNQWIKRCYNGCNENQPYFFLHIYTLKLISFLELPSWKFVVFLFFFLFGLCLISLLEVCYSPGGRVGASHFLTGKGRQAWTGARVRLDFKKKNQVLTQLKSRLVGTWKYWRGEGQEVREHSHLESYIGFCSADF